MLSKKFFDTVREKIFGGHLSQAQVDSLNLIDAEAHKRGLEPAQLAYVFGTIWHESGHTLLPVEEIGKGRGYDYGKKLDMGGGKGKRVAYETPDKIFYGRGYIQVTWLTNYKNLTAAAKKQGLDYDFVNNPELLLQDQPSAWASIYGMRVGLFTGKKLTDYIQGTKVNFVDARKIINGTDQAQRIAGYANIFLQALS